MDAPTEHPRGSAEERSALLDRIAELERKLSAQRDELADNLDALRTMIRNRSKYDKPHEERAFRVALSLFEDP